MCGILFTNKESIDKNEFIRALASQKHRGPDVPLCYEQVGFFQFGHNRLKILDLENRSNQPFYSKDKRFIIIFNGEIYNFRELAKQHNISLQTTSDTELLLELYIRYKESALPMLNGMFAFVIVDTINNSFFAARDRLGIKPLYFTQEGNQYIFSSEISSIVNLKKSLEIDEVGFRQYKKLRTFFNSRTLYKNIHMFPAGHFLKEGTINRFWELPEGEQTAPDDDEIRDLLHSAINYRCIADVSVGSYLSGGLDSTIVAGLSGELHTWTVGFEEENEFKWSQNAAQKFQTTHHPVKIEERDYLPLASYMLEKRKEPLSVPNEVLIYHMTKEVKKHNTVILSGEGADELFFGYDRIFRWAQNTKNWDIKEFTKLYAYGSDEDYEIVEDVISPFKKYGKPIDIVAAFFQIAHLHGLLRRLDNATMLCSVEARVPFVDHKLIERMAGVSFDYRMKNGIVKAPLKRVFSDLVPSEIIMRKKIGFPVNLTKVIPENIPGNTHFDKWFNFNLYSLEKNLGLTFNK